MKANIVLYAKEESRSWASEASGVQRNCCWTSELDAGDSSRNWAAESEPFFRGNWSGKVYGHVFRSWSSKHIWTVRCIFTSVILYFCCKVQIRRGDGGMILYIRYYMDRKFLRCSKYDLWLIMQVTYDMYMCIVINTCRDSTPKYVPVDLPQLRLGKDQNYVALLYLDKCNEKWILQTILLAKPILYLELQSGTNDISSHAWKATWLILFKIPDQRDA